MATLRLLLTFPSETTLSTLNFLDPKRNKKKHIEIPILPSMASTTSPSSFSLLLRGRNSRQVLRSAMKRRKISANSGRGGLRILVKQSSDQRPPKTAAASGVDTRIHWENEDEGWLGGRGSGNSETPQKDKDKKQKQSKSDELFEDQKNPMGENFSDLLNTSSDSHYQFLGVSVTADLEEIKGAYRRLSKEYHPDTTSLPLKAASDKFMKLKQVYDMLSDEERRRFYDWTLAQEVASRESEKMKMKLEDPYMQDLENWESVPDMVDRLGGKNMELSDQAVSALTFDVLIIIFSICCIIYVIFFKEPYYY